MNLWPHNLPPPVDPLHNTRIAMAMSVLTRDGKRPTYSEAEQYAIEQMRDHPTNFAGSYGDLAHGV